MKDYEFSRATIEEAWTAGVLDVRRSVSGWDKIRPEEAGPEVKIYRPTETLPLHKQAAEYVEARAAYDLSKFSSGHIRDPKTLAAMDQAFAAVWIPSAILPH